jgi:hypothetical protein
MRVSTLSAPALAAVLLALVSLASCKREAPINGIGGFEIGKTQLGQLSGRCLPASEEPLMYCPGIAAVALGDQNASIDLYFGGKSTDATLVEILLDVSFCRPDALEAYLVEKLREPERRIGSRAFWTNEYVHISAALPAEPSRCEVNFVSVKDARRIETIEKAAQKAADKTAGTEAQKPAEPAPGSDAPTTP